MITHAEALDWLNSKVGQHLDYDHAYGQQCVDFFNYYYQEVTGDSPYSHGYGVRGAKDLWNVGNDKLIKLPDSSTLVPQPGDIAIYGAAWGAGYGHVEVVIATDASGCTFIGENEHGNTSEGVVRVHRTWSQMRGLIGVMRFIWNVPTPPPPPPPVPVPAPKPYVPPAAPVVITKAEQLEVLTNLPYYKSADEVAKAQNPVDVIQPGKYYVWAKEGTNGNYWCLSTSNSKNDEMWINTVSNKKPLNVPNPEPKPAPVPVTVTLQPPVEKPVERVETSADIMASWKWFYKTHEPVNYVISKPYRVYDQIHNSPSIEITPGKDLYGEPKTVEIYGTFQKSGITYLRPLTGTDEKGLYSFYGIPTTDIYTGVPYLNNEFNVGDKVQYGADLFIDKTVKTIEGVYKWLRRSRL